jgi:hypothetical protein
MTQRQIRKLETILGKLEALEHETTDRVAREALHSGKNALLIALRCSDTAGKS